MEGVKNQWVRSGGRAELIREGGVNEVDKEFVREQGDCFIVCVRCGDMIWSARQGVRSTEILPGMCSNVRSNSDKLSNHLAWQ